MKGADRKEELVRSYRWVNEFLQQIQMKEREGKKQTNKQTQCEQPRW